jgi:cold shock CspA family protein/ribosome-associated translation inhibitor RaiA
MRLPLQITFRNLQPSAAVEANIREKAEKLNEFYGDIMACRVVIEAPHKHQNKGNLYHVRIDLTIPNSELIVSRNPALHQAHQDVYVAIRDAFEAARRRLEDFARRQRRHVKTHEVPLHGRISGLFPEMSYGHIKMANGREIYFHQNSVLNADFRDLTLGAEVRFVEEQGEQGPQASTVTIVRKHHIVG